MSSQARAPISETPPGRRGRNDRPVTGKASPLRTGLSLPDAVYQDAIRMPEAIDLKCVEPCRADRAHPTSGTDFLHWQRLNRQHIT